MYADTDALYDRLAKAFMPGPLTVIMPRKPIIPLSTTGGLETVAVRCPSHPVAHALIAAAGVPIAAPSANLSGKPSPTCAAHVAQDMDGRVDMILDGGDCKIGLESTIVKLDRDGDGEFDPAPPRRHHIRCAVLCLRARCDCTCRHRTALGRRASALAGYEVQALCARDSGCAAGGYAGARSVVPAGAAEDRALRHPVLR